MPLLRRLLYRSRSRLPGCLEDVSRQASVIAARSRARNAHDGLSGVLVFSAGYFVQVLEGQLPNIEPVFERIQRDERHDDIRIVDCAALPRRAFAEWAMGYEQAPEDSALARAISFDPSLGGSAPHPADLVSLIRGLIDGRAPRVAELADG